MLNLSLIYGSIYHHETKGRAGKSSARPCFHQISVKGGTQAEAGDAQVIEGLREARETELWSPLPQADFNNLGCSFYLHLGDWTTMEESHLSALDESEAFSYMIDSRVKCFSFLILAAAAAASSFLQAYERPVFICSPQRHKASPL